jgi:hypothetical protein
MDDHQLLAVLRGALEDDRSGSSGPAEPPAAPPEVVDVARAAWAWRAVEEELASLVYDSADDPALAGVRGPAGDRQLTFRWQNTILDIEILQGRLLGQLTPGPAGQVRLGMPPERWQELVVDDRGRFVVAQLPPGPIRLSYALADGAARSTGWILP